MAEALDEIIGDEREPASNDAANIAGHLIGIARMQPEGEIWEEYRPVIAQGIEDFIAKTGGFTDRLAYALSELAGPEDMQFIKDIIGSLGTSREYTGDYNLPSARRLLHNFVDKEGGSGYAASIEFESYRRLVTFPENIYGPWVESATDLADSVNDTSRDFTHRARHLARLENPRGGGKVFHLNGGSPGSWETELNLTSFHPNSTYHVNGYIYRTDSQGRVISVEGNLADRTSARNGYRQRQVGRSSGVHGDQGGHLIATSLGGPGDKLNLVPMNGNLNMGRWRVMEKSWTTALRAGQPVYTNIQVVYGQGNRPTSFVVDYRINNVPTRAIFRNRGR